MSEFSNVNDRLVFGEKGLIIYSDGESSTNESFSCIQVIEDAVISISTISNSEPIVDLAVTAGMPIYGMFKGVSVTSGKIIAYKR